MKEIWQKWCWLIIGVVNVLIALLVGHGVTSWSGDISTIGGYTFVTMFLFGAAEIILWYNKHEYLPMSVITSGLVGTVLTLLIY